MAKNNNSRGKKYNKNKKANRRVSNFIIGNGLLNKQVSNSKSLHNAAYTSTGIIGRNMSPENRSRTYNLFRIIYALSFIWLLKFMFSALIGIIKR